MKVLHVHQIAHIPELLVAELRERGVDAKFAEEARTPDVRGCDIVHGHYALNRHTIHAFRLARKFGIPFVLHCHGSDLRLLTGTGRRRLPLHYRMISEHIRDRSAGILLSTPDLVEFEPRGTYVPNPVNLDRFRPMSDVDKTTRHLICGRQVKGSRLLEFVRPDVEYDCVNNGHPYKFPQNVRMLPYVDYARFNEFLNRYEFMLGTVGDVISMSRLEAMACGLRTFTDFEEKFTEYYDGQNPDDVAEPRNFIQRYHSPGKAADTILRFYDGILPSR